jgi:hypothetical protein
MDDLDPAAGAMHAMPVSGEQSFAPPCGGRGRGRPKGSRNKATLALEAVLEEAAEELTHKLVDTALAGDGAALRFCLGRLLPPLRDRPVMFDLPPIESAGDLVTASRAVLAACAEGILTPHEATQVMDLITSARAIIETARRMTAWESRLQACEAKTSREIDKSIAAARRTGCKSPVFNSAKGRVGWAKSPVAAARLTLRAARFCPRGAPSMRVRTARAAPFAHPTGSAFTRSIRGPPTRHAS